MKRYQYLGTQQPDQQLMQPSNRLRLVSARSILDWIKLYKPPRNPDKTVTLTFIVDLEGAMWINDRHSEHVFCANGGDVLSAGEITFEINEHEYTAQIEATTNQSTGYCPQPESYEAVKSAIEATGIEHPPSFTTEFVFRLCNHCNTINILKDDWFYCGVCDRELDEFWNFE